MDEWSYRDEADMSISVKKKIAVCCRAARWRVCFTLLPLLYFSLGLASSSEKPMPPARHGTFSLNAGAPGDRGMDQGAPYYRVCSFKRNLVWRWMATV